MKAMNRALRQLKGQVGETAKLDENLKLVSDLQRACIAAKGVQVPDDVLSRKGKTPEEKKKLSDGFRRDLLAAARLLLDVEAAILDEKADVATAKLDEFAKLRDASHERMGIKD